MKKMNTLLKTMLLFVSMCCFTLLSAQTSVSNFTEFDNALQSMKAGTGGTITLTASITIEIAKGTTYEIKSTAEAPIVINAGSNSITAAGVTGNATVDNTMLEVGDNVTINGSATLLQSTNRAIISVTGGLLQSTPSGNANNAAVIKTTAGMVQISGGTIKMDGSGVTSGNAFAIHMGSHMALNVTGGTIEGSGIGTRVVRIAGGTANISGATIIATGGASGTTYALLANVQDNVGNQMTIGSNTTITTTGTTAYALVTGGNNAAIKIASDAENVTITSENPYKRDGGATSVIFDATNIGITADIPSGTTITEESKEITFTLTGANADFTSTLFYAFNDSPTTSSAVPTVTSKEFKITVTPDNPTVKIRFGKGNWIDTKDFVFSYDFNSGGTGTDVSDFTEFDNALQTMKAGTGGQINLTGNITITIPKGDTYSISSTETAPVTINAGAYSITAASDSDNTTDDNTILEVGDNVSILGTATLLKNANRVKINVTGGLIESTVPGNGGSAAAIRADQGWLNISGGKISVSAANATEGNAFAVYMGNFYTLNVTGGTLEGTGYGVRVVRIADGTANISGATINATAAATGNIFALLANGGNQMTIGDNTTITTTGENAYALVTGGGSAAIRIASDAQNVVINSENPYRRDNNSTSFIFDGRDAGLTADPVSGTETQEDELEITFTVTGSSADYINAAFYDFNATPTTASTSIAISDKTFKIKVTPSKPTVKISFGKGSWIDSQEFEFTYDFQNDPGQVINVNTQEEFNTALATLKAAEGGTINLLANIDILIAKGSTYSLASTETAPIKINAENYAITATSDVDNTTDDNTILEIGDNVTIEGTATLIKNANKVKINVTGGVIKSEIPGNGGGAAAIRADAGWLNISGGTISVNAPNATDGNAFAVYVGNYYRLNITGGTLEGTGHGIRVIRIADGAANISNATITANATATGNAYALFAHNSNVMTIGDNTTVNAIGDNAFALVGGGASSIIAIAKDATNVTVNVDNADNMYKLDNVGAGIYDLRDLAIVADPVSGTSTTETTLNVTLTVEGATAAYGNYFYSIDGTPTTTSTNFAPTVDLNPNTVTATSANNVIYVKFGKGNWMDTEEYTFTYNLPSSGVMTPEYSADAIVLSQLDNVLYLSESVDCITVISLNGKTVKQANNTNSVNIAELATGVYLIKIQYQGAETIKKTIR